MLDRESSAMLQLHGTASAGIPVTIEVDGGRLTVSVCRISTALSVRLTRQTSRKRCRARRVRKASSSFGTRPPGIPGWIGVFTGPPASWHRGTIQLPMETHTPFFASLRFRFRRCSSFRHAYHRTLESGGTPSCSPDYELPSRGRACSPERTRQF